MIINKLVLLVVFALLASSCKTISDVGSKVGNKLDSMFSRNAASDKPQPVAKKQVNNNTDASSLQTGESFHLIKKIDNNNITADASVLNSSGVRNPFKIIDEIANKQLTAWLERASNITPFNKSKPQRPVLPMPTLLRKGEFETTEAFGRRVTDAERQRVKVLQKIERDFQAAIDAYNAEVNIYNEAIANERKRRRETAERKYWEFVNANLNEVLGQPQIAVRRYNADEQIFYAELVSTNSNLAQWVKVYVPINKAKSFKYNATNAKPILSFARDSNNELYISGALVELGTERYTAKVINRPSSYHNPEHVVRSKGINVSDRYLIVNQ